MITRLQQQLEKEARDLTVLRAVIEHAPIGIVTLSQVTDIPEHKVRYSLRMLESDELIEPTPEGAVPGEDIAERVNEINDGIDELVEHLRGLELETKA